MGAAAITHAAAAAAAASAAEIDDGNIFGCAAAFAADAETELLKGGACRSRWNARFFSTIDVKVDYWAKHLFLPFHYCTTVVDKNLYSWCQFDALVNNSSTLSTLPAFEEDPPSHERSIPLSVAPSFWGIRAKRGIRFAAATKAGASVANIQPCSASFSPHPSIPFRPRKPIILAATVKRSKVSVSQAVGGI